MGCGGSKDSKDQRGKDGAPRPFEPNWATPPAEDVALGQETGLTAHAKVHQGTFQGSAALIKAYATGASFSDKGIREALALSNLKHDNVVKLLGVCVAPAHFVVLERSELGSVHEALVQNKRALRWDQALKVADGVINGICCIHGLGRGELIHGNINSGTVMLSTDWTAKLTDFENSHLVGEHGQATADDIALPYAAPEMLTKNKVLVKCSDIYCFGILLTTIMARSEPFLDEYGADQDGIYTAIFKGERPEIPEFCPAPLVKLVEQCTLQDLIQRPDAKQCKKALLMPKLRKGQAPGFAVIHPHGSAMEVEAKSA